MEDPTGLAPMETSWTSRDGGKSIDFDPVHDIPYNFLPQNHLNSNTI
jgi:hypothetical protein